MSTYEQPLTQDLLLEYPICAEIINNYFMRLSMISRIIQTEDNVTVSDEAKLRRISLTARCE